MGRDVLLASTQVNLETWKDSVELELGPLEPGHYFVDCGGERQNFHIVERHARPRERRLAISLLIPSDGSATEHTLRSLCECGVRVDAWSNCRFALTCVSASGSLTKFFCADNSGQYVLHLSDLPINDAVTWINLRARSWLAQSNEMHLVSKPYVDRRDVCISGGWLRAKVHGAPAGTPASVMLVPSRPWRDQLEIIPVVVASDCHIATKIPDCNNVEWLAIVDAQVATAWLISRAPRPSTPKVTDFRSAVQGISKMQMQLQLLGVLGADAAEIVGFLSMALLAQKVAIPASRPRHPTG